MRVDLEDLGEIDLLGVLKVGRRGIDELALRTPGMPKKLCDGREQRLLLREKVLPEEEDEVGRHEVVAAPARRELGSHLSELFREGRLHVHVHVLQGGVKRELVPEGPPVEPGQLPEKGPSLLGGEELLADEHPDMSGARENVVGKERPVLLYRGTEGGRLRVWWVAKALS